MRYPPAMKIFTRRNAVVGYLALKALRRSRRNAAVGFLAAQGLERTRARRRGGRALRIALYATLALVSFGILAAALRFARRQSSIEEQSFEAGEEPAESAADSDTDTVAEATSELDGAFSMEPAPAT